jgi:hypothetical protein
MDRPLWFVPCSAGLVISPSSIPSQIVITTSYLLMAMLDIVDTGCCQTGWIPT